MSATADQRQEAIEAIERVKAAEKKHKKAIQGGSFDQVVETTAELFDAEVAVALTLPL